jgi:hypothetical protein
MRSTVKGYVRKAFALLTDLAENVDFINSNSTGFNYATGLPVISTPTTHTIRAVVINESMLDTNKSITKILVATELLEAAGIYDLSIFNKVTVRGVTMSVVHSKDSQYQITNNGYTTTLYAILEDS